MRRVLIPRRLSAVAPHGENRQAGIVLFGGETMGTTWSVKLSTQSEEKLASLRDDIQEVLDLVIAQMSTWKTDSHISRFNTSAANTWHRLPDQFAEVLRYALTLAEQTGGAYDPTIGALVDLWGFGPAGRGAHTPGIDCVSRVRAQCGWKRTRLTDDPPRAFQPGGLRLDLSSIAKGFAVDLAADRLEALRISNYLVEIGGELRGKGTKPDGSPWWVLLEQPQGSHVAAQPIETVVALHGLAVATSGDTQRWYEHDGARLSHTIDPRTGYPAAGDLASVSVLHQRCMRADAIATALMVLGPEAGFGFACEHGIGARFVVRTDSGFRERLTPFLAAMAE